MPAPVAVIIARPEHTKAFKKWLGSSSAVSLFEDSESLRAVEAILKRPPKLLAIDRIFAETSRAAALVSRLKTASPSPKIDLRVLLEDEANVPLILAQPLASLEEALLQTSRPLDRAGTRRAVRFSMNRRPVVVNGEEGELVDLSVTGAQILLPLRVQPSQPLRLTIVDGPTEIRCNGSVAWSVAVPMGGTIRYRAGMEFISPDTKKLEALCNLYGGPPDHTFGAA